jgi:hypothetical protein
MKSGEIKLLKIAVVDGQGGDIGRQIIEAVRREIYWDVQVIALGTNSMATAAMVKAGANIGATGENAIVNASRGVDLIVGPVGIIAADAMNGEITDTMAFAIAASLARKMLIPFSKCDIEITGVDKSLSLAQMVEKAVGMIKIVYHEARG